MSEEPQFFRIRARAYVCHWVADVRIGVSISLTTQERAAKIFINPSKAELDYVKFAIGVSTLEPATYAEWIEQDPDRELRKLPPE